MELDILRNLGNTHIYLGYLIPCFIVRDSGGGKIEYLLEFSDGISGFLTVDSIYSYCADGGIIKCNTIELPLKLGDFIAACADSQFIAGI